MEGLVIASFTVNSSHVRQGSAHLQRYTRLRSRKLEDTRRTDGSVGGPTGFTRDNTVQMMTASDRRQEIALIHRLGCISQTGLPAVSHNAWGLAMIFVERLTMLRRPIMVLNVLAAQHVEFINIMPQSTASNCDQ